MCGIAGVWGPGERGPLVARMLDSLRHRGPDGEGSYASSRWPATIGARRLAIIDREGGRQPMSNEDGTIQVILNGEIYNHKELRKRLAGRHELKTRCDTEVLPHLYEEYGPDFLQELDGMFALALLDERKGLLLLARDRLGEKPLVYAVGRGRLAFASEIKGILQDEGIGRSVDPEALELYLGYLYVGAPRTMFREIRKLPPGHRAEWRGNSLSIQPYWRPEPRALPDEAVRSLVEGSVRMRLESDIGIGCFLSGGIDSTIVTSLAARSVPELATISVGFEDPAHDELRHADRISRLLGTRHHRLVVRPDALGLIGEVSRIFDEPFADSSALPTFLLCREASKLTRVALGGDGGDECFGGYRRHAAMASLPMMRRLPDTPARLVARVLRRRASRARRRLAQMVLMRASRPAEIYRMLVTFHSQEDRVRFGLPGAGEQVRDFIEGPYERFDSDPVNAAGYVDLVTYLPGDLLAKTDICSMANGLEVRSPFLDHRVVEAALGVPGRRKIRGATTKMYLRQLFRDLLPISIRKRAKHGFSIPLASWLEGPLKSILDDSLLSPGARTSRFLDSGGVRGILAEHRSGRSDHAEALWALLMLELWMRRFRI